MEQLLANLATGFSVADEDSPLHKLMEKVQAKHSVILKAVRSPINFKKAGAKALP